MKHYKGTITLNKNSRGCYVIDTVKGCAVCGGEKPLGCYDNCYARDIAKRYGYEFGDVVEREFEQDRAQLFLFDMTDDEHARRVVAAIKAADMPFVRIGEMGDPSYAWEHTIDVCRIISAAGKPIVIITKHWKVLPDEFLHELKALGICINTSISALDSNDEIQHRLAQYERFKPHCRSVLRVVTCDFNVDDREGLDREIMQGYLMGQENILETVFRPSADNQLVRNKIINVEKRRFLGATVLTSMRDPATFIGYCAECPDMCGINASVLS